MKRGKVVRCKGIKSPNYELMKDAEKEGCTYFGIAESDKIKENEMKGNKLKQYK